MTVSTSGKGAEKSLDELVKYVELYVRNPVILSGVVLPFVPLYLAIFYLWYNVFGPENYEAGIIGVVIVVCIHILTLLACYWSVHVLAFLNCKRVKVPNDGVLCKVVPTPNNGSSEMVPIKSMIMADNSIQFYFLFQKTKYVWDEDKATFRTVDFPVNLYLSEYVSSTGHTSEIALEEALKTYGNNTMEMVVPEFFELFAERATAPFFVFQVFSVALWCLDEYWYYSMLTLVMLIAFECSLVHQQVSNMSEIRKMGNKPYMINVLRKNKWSQIKSDQLVPGDVVSIVRSQDEIIVPCDMVLLRGRCIVDESLLTGESVPQMKESLENVNDYDVELNVEGDGKLFVLFGGTKVVQHTSPSKDSIRAPDGGCICYVIRTGFNTSQGKLLRTILFGGKRVTENNLETFAFIMFLMVFAIAAASYVWIKGIEDPERSRYKLFLECTLILTSIIPPDLSIEFSLTVNTSLLQLTKSLIFCTEPFRIPYAGKVQICCFDKTGTLTSDNLVVEGIAGLNDSDEIQKISTATVDTIRVMAACHSLVLLEETLVGDPLEKAILTSVDWNLTKVDVVVPKKSSSMNPIKIKQRFYFSSALKRMSVLAGYLAQANKPTYFGAVKGAPETIMSMLTTVPPNYEQTYKKYTTRGSRVLALAFKNFGFLNQQELVQLQRSDIECNLTFAGFVIVSCPIKPDSKSTIKELIQASQKVVMITGDYPLTACHVAQELHFVRKKLVTLTHIPRLESWSWESMDNQELIDYDPNTMKELKSQYDFCITGDGLQFLRQRGDTSILPYISVFARFAPKEKEFVINALKQLGFHVLMCGDGTNDVGALKHAHVGVSLLSHGSIVTKKKPEIGSLASTFQQSSNLSHRMPGQRMPLPHGALHDRPNMTPRERAMLRSQELFSEAQARLREAREMEEVTIIKLGDASIAAPFTSKNSSISCVNHIIKQGRCTLVATMQMFKILALNSLISAYCQSVLYIDGVKFSDTQATLQGLFTAACFLFITRSKPLKTLSKIAPLPNIFNAYTISTILLQFAIHFSSLYYLTQEATSLAPPRLEKVKLFADMTAEEKQKFEPNIINSTVYIICLSLQVSTFAVNYKGRPFMESLSENRLLLMSILVPAFVVICLSLGLISPLTNAFEIINFPSNFRYVIVVVLIIDIVAAYAADRICAFFFGDNQRKSKALNY